METFVVPRYLSFFGELLLEMLLVGSESRMVHLGCRTGYPDLRVYDLFEAGSLVGVDPSASALELGRNKASVLGGIPIDYELAPELPTPLLSEQYSHAFTLHPPALEHTRAALFAEMHRLLYSGGQALVALPVRGSFQEVSDLLLEYALKDDDSDLAKATELALLARPSEESLAEELEQAGFEDVDIEVQSCEIHFDSGRAFFEDPATRLLILPEILALLGKDELRAPLRYVRDAIDKYWAEGTLGLTLQVGCASARRG